MRVLYVTHYSGFYGANRSLLRLILELREIYGVIPLVIVPMKGVFTNELNEKEIDFEIYRFYNWQNIGNSWMVSFTKQALNWFLFANIAKDLKKKKIGIDLIHTNTSITNLGGYLSKVLNIPHIWHIREFGALDFNTKYLNGIKKAGKYYESHSNHIVAISKKLKDYYSNYISEKKIKVIYNGVELNENLTKGFNSKDSLRLCFVGVITENKNQMEAIRACEYLIKKNVTDFMLQFVGDGPDAYHPSLVNYVREKHLENHVEFVGYVDKINPILEKSDVGIVCSKNEAFGRVTVEYMAQKMPVIASNTGANPEIIEHGSTGYLYEIGNYKSLALHIQRLIEDRSLLINLGKNAYATAARKFTSKINTDTIFELYREVKGNKIS